MWCRRMPLASWRETTKWISPYHISDVGRFRTNVFQQRGQFCFAMRYVKTRIPTFEELGLMEVLKTIAQSPRGIVLVAGSTGSGQIDYPGRDGRFH